MCSLAAGPGSGKAACLFLLFAIFALNLAARNDVLAYTGRAWHFAGGVLA